MREIPSYDELFVLMDANADTGTRGEGRVGDKDNGVFGAYHRYTLHDIGERLLSCETRSLVSVRVMHIVPPTVTSNKSELSTFSRDSAVGTPRRENTPVVKFAPS